MAKEVQLYEMGLLLKPELPEHEAGEQLGIVRSYIEKHGGMPERTTDPKLRKLAYPIKKLTQAYFAALQFSIIPEAVQDIKKDVNANEHILRHLILHWENEPDKPMIRKTAQPKREETPELTTEEKVAQEKQIDEQLDQILGE